MSHIPQLSMAADSGSMSTRLQNKSQYRHSGSASSNSMRTPWLMTSYIVLHSGTSLGSSCFRIFQKPVFYRLVHVPREFVEANGRCMGYVQRLSLAWRHLKMTVKKKKIRVHSVYSDRSFLQQDKSWMMPTFFDLCMKGLLTLCRLRSLRWFVFGSLLVRKVNALQIKDVCF